jgi:hypothetical protein
MVIIIRHKKLRIVHIDFRLDQGGSRPRQLIGLGSLTGARERGVRGSHGSSWLLQF